MKQRDCNSLIQRRRQYESVSYLVVQCIARPFDGTCRFPDASANRSIPDLCATVSREAFGVSTRQRYGYPDPTMAEHHLRQLVQVNINFVPSGGGVVYFFVVCALCKVFLFNIILVPFDSRCYGAELGLFLESTDACSARARLSNFYRFWRLQTLSVCKGGRTEKCVRLKPCRGRRTGLCLI